MQHSQNAQPRILVAGASGRLGYRVVEILSKLGGMQVVAASRTPQKLEILARAGIETRKADFDDINSLLDSFQGIDRLLLISTDELHRPGTRIRQHLNAIQAAKALGIQHVVYTSMPRPEAANDIPFASDHVATEEALINSGITFNSLRVSWYAENMLGFLPQILKAGIWPTAGGDGRIAYIPREDVARVAAAAILKATQTTYWDITGPEVLSIPQVATIASEVFGKSIVVQQVEAEQLNDALVDIGIPRDFTSTIVMTDLNTRAGNFDILNDIVLRETGKKPGTLHRFFLENRELFLCS